MAILILHPARIALAIFAGLVVVTVVLAAGARAAGRRRVRDIYRAVFSQRHRERQLVAATAFYVTFAVVRLLTHAIRAGRGPFHNIEVGGRHIHHLRESVSCRTS